jgi:hypothetical protein
MMKLALLKIYLHFRQLELQAGETSGLNPKRMKWLDLEIMRTKNQIKVEEFKSACATLMKS